MRERLVVLGTQSRDAWYRLGTPDAINWVSMLIVTFLFVSGAFGANVLVVQGRESIFAFMSFASVAALGVGLWVCRWAIRLIPLASVRPWATLVAFELANVIRSWVFDELFVAFSFGDTHRLLYRIGTGQISGVLGLILAGLLVPYARASTKAYQDLSEAARALEQLRRDAKLKLEEQREALTSRVKQALEAGLLPLTGFAAEEDARTLRHAIDNVVRPLSLQLSWESGGIDQIALSNLTRKISWRTIVTSTLKSNPVHPLPFLIWVAFVVAQVALIFQLDHVWLGALVSVCVTGALLFTVRWMWPQPNIRANYFLRSASLTAVFIFAGLVCSLSFQFILGFDWFGSGNWLWACVQSIGIGWSVALVAGARDVYSSSNRALTAALDDLRHQIASMNGANRQLQKDVARIVHGPIQDVITQALRRAETLAPGEQLTDDYIQAVRAQIGSAIDSLSSGSGTTLKSGPQAPGIRRMLTDLADMWGGSVDITFLLKPRDEEILNSDAMAVETLFEIIRESCSNAVRHGDAQTIDVVISCDEAQRIARTIISNDGARLRDTPVAGLGTRAMDDLTVTWSRKQVADRVVVDAVIPLQADPSTGASHS